MCVCFASLLPKHSFDIFHCLVFSFLLLILSISFYSHILHLFAKSHFGTFYYTLIYNFICVWCRIVAIASHSFHTPFHLFLFRLYSFLTSYFLLFCTYSRCCFFFLRSFILTSAFSQPAKLISACTLSHVFVRGRYGANKYYLSLLYWMGNDNDGGYDEDDASVCLCII